MVIDTHCHLIDPQFNHDVQEVCARARKSGVTYIINAGYDCSTSQGAYNMHLSIPWLLPAVGIHPNEAAAESVSHIGMIQSLAAHEGIIAIGETGLDYYRDWSPRDAQQELFRLHIEIARVHNLPLLVHTRNSIDDAIRILESKSDVSGVFHCYSGPDEQAKRILDMGFYLGFGGVVTFSKRMREIVKDVPLDNIVLETDAPFLAPATHRGKRNEPSYLRETLYTVASVMEKSPEYVERITDENAHALFSIDDT